MEYKDIIREIKEMYDNDFNMDSFRCAGRINKKINKIAINQNMKDVRKEYNYHAIKNYLEEMVFNKLKEKLGYEDEVIKKIIKYLSYAEAIHEIYVIDGIVAVKALSKTNNSPEIKSFFIPEDGFCDITSANFNNISGYGVLKELIVGSINKVISNNLGIIEPLILKENGEINYSKYNINIFLNSNLSHLGKINENINNDIIKILVKRGINEIYYFDMKLRDGYLVIYQNEFPVNKVSSILNDNVKVKAM